MEYNFIDNNFKSEIEINVINKVFPNLNIIHQTLLFEMLLNIIDIISIKFGFNLSNRIIYEKQFRQNNYKDVIGLLYLLLPFIDDTNNEKKINLKSLDDLYIQKKKKSINNINKGEPQYEYTNLQYNRSIRINKEAKEIQFTEEHLKHNYYLLLNTIQIISNKLYVNWINIRPLDPKTATNGYL